MLFHQVFRQGKLEADRKQNYIYKTKFHCPPRTENQIISVKPSFTVRPARSVSLAPPEAYRSPCSEGASHSARRVHSTPLGACYSPCPKRVTRPARSVLVASLEACCSPRPKRVTRPARSVLVAPLGACYSPRSKRVTRPARSVLVASFEAYRSSCSKAAARLARRLPLVLLEECRSSCSKSVARPARRVSLVMLEAYRSPRPKYITRLTRSDAPMLFHQVFRQGKLEADRKQNYIYKTKFHCPPCSEGVVPRVVRSASTIKSEKYFRNVRDKSRAGIGVHFVEYGVNFPLRKRHYCKSRF